MNDRQLRDRNAARRKLDSKPDQVFGEVISIDPLTVSPGGGATVPARTFRHVTLTVGQTVEMLKQGSAPYLVLGPTTREPGKWATLTLESNWSGAIQYRLRGDIVEVRGFATRDSGSTNLIGTLPTGFAPSSDVYDSAVVSSAAALVRLDTARQLRFYNLATDTSQTSGLIVGIARFPTT